jgi:hypothetical protein
MQCLTSNDSLTLLQELNVAGDFKLRPILLYHAKNAKVLKSYTSYFCLCYITGSTHPGLENNLLQHGSLNILSPPLRHTNWKWFVFKILLFIGKELGHPRALMEMDQKMNAIFMPVNTVPICSHG